MNKKTIPGNIAAKNRNAPQGMALLLCLLMTTTLCLIGGAALSVSGLNRMIVHNNLKQTQAFYTAEAGLEAAFARLKQDPLWRGGGSSFHGALDIDGLQGTYAVMLSDNTPDGNGISNPLLPARHVMITSAGAYIDAARTISCLVGMTPGDIPAAFPLKAVISAGAVTGPITPLDDFGIINNSLLASGTPLPEANATSLHALADVAFSFLDNDEYDAFFEDTTGFWLDSPADSRPHIIYVQGDLDISGDRQLCGIVFVAGRHINLSGTTACIHGILYAPNAVGISIRNSGTSGRIVVEGQLAAGPGGVDVSGNPIAIRLNRDFVNAFNNAAGDAVDVVKVSGSWRSL